MICKLCGRDSHCLVSYKTLKRTIKYCCPSCFFKMKEKTVEKK